MSTSDPSSFRFDAEVEPGNPRQFRYEIGKTYLGDPVEVPITIIDGAEDGPRLFMTAAIHGDELYGVKVLQEVAARCGPADIHGAVVLLHVVNVPGYQTQ